MSLYETELRNINEGCLDQALALLPAKMNSLAARAQLLKTALQESRGTARRQMGNGPARGLWQFELGTERSRGGVWGVFLHPDTRAHMASLCDNLGVPCNPQAIYSNLEHNDVLAAGVARLNYWWNPAPLPAVDDGPGSWNYYLKTWRPGKPHDGTWAAFHQAVLHYLAAQ